MPIGKIIKGVGGLYSVVCEDKTYFCSARGVFRKQEITPLPGDEVEFEIDSLQKEYGSIQVIKERRSLLIRPAVSNVELLLIVLTLNAPLPDFILTDMLILNAIANAVTPVICVNKTDLPAPEDLRREITGYQNAGFQTVFTTIEKNRGYDQLLELLKGKTTIFAGQSGVGKSTLFNGILECEHMPIGSMSQKINRGRHTTRHVELVKTKSDGYIIDSPGFSSFNYEVENYRELDRYYPEFQALSGQCRFKECSHIHEPECVVLDELEAGRIHLGRHRRYVELYKKYKEMDDKKYLKKK